MQTPVDRIRVVRMGQSSAFARAMHIHGSLARVLQPVVDIQGRIVLWKCSQCRWTHSLADQFTGMSPSPIVVESFQRHNCVEHNGPD